MKYSSGTTECHIFLASAPAFILAAAFTFPATVSADEITGVIEDWPHETADIATGFMEPRIIGQVDPAGKVRIPLPADYTQQTIEETKAQNAANSEWEASMRTAGEAWGCDTGELEVSNGDKFAVNLSTMGSFMIGSMEKDVGYGVLVVANSREFAERYDPFSGDMTPGWYMDWVHAETEITISGECEELPLSLPETSLERVTSYQIKLAPGWNLLKHEIEEVYEDEIGRVWPTRSSYSTLESLPDDTEFVFVSDD